MEHTNEIKSNRMNVAMVIGIYLAIILMIVAIIVLVKNIDEIRTDPITYGIERHGFNMCSCYDGDGLIYHYDDGEGNNNGFGFEIGDINLSE